MSRNQERSGTRRGQRGISRFEAKLGAVAVLLTLSGVVFAMNRSVSDAREQESHEAAAKILKAATGYTSDGGDGCPTVSSLVRDELLDGDTPFADAWGQRFRVHCDGELSVRSAGADGKLNSEDDVHVSSQELAANGSALP